jgi:hypothetical protein
VVGLYALSVLRTADLWAVMYGPIRIMNVGVVDIETDRVGLGFDVDGRAGKQTIESEEQRVAAHPRGSSFSSVPLLFGPLDSQHASPLTRPTTLSSSHTTPAAHAHIAVLRDFVTPILSSRRPRRTVITDVSSRRRVPLPCGRCDDNSELSFRSCNTETENGTLGGNIAHIF